MPGDFSRKLFAETNHYSGVLMQQGRVQLDADWNEQLAIQHHRTHVESADVIGRCGTPKDGTGFEIKRTPRGDDLIIGRGRYYAGGRLCEVNPSAVPVSLPEGSKKQVQLASLIVDGRELQAGQWISLRAAKKKDELLAEITAVDLDKRTVTLDVDVSAYNDAGPAWLERVITYATQPDYPDPMFTIASPLGGGPSGGPVSLHDGVYLVHLQCWEREVNALEHARIREVALNGPDSTERLQTVWQVRLLELPSREQSPLSSPLGEADCKADFPEWDRHIARQTGTLNVRTVALAEDSNPCVLPPQPGYQLLENQLYRIEIFRGADSRDKATFVWSRDNGSVETTITKVDGNHVYLHDLGKDDVLGFAAGQWVEIVDREDDLDVSGTNGLPSGATRFLARITEAPDRSENRVTLSSSAAAYANRSGLRLRRWDMTGNSVTADGLPITSGWIDLEGGIQAWFSEGSYGARAYWLVPARTATREVEWPPFENPNANPIPQPPAGPNYQFCRLALLEVIAGNWTIHDCRDKFPSLTDICADDICYESKCDMPGVTTVQDALDTLCQGQDLRFHNKHLHGWGIVCGLQVNCGPDDAGAPRHHVTVRPGYALTCEGDDVIVEDEQQVDVINTLLRTQPAAYTVSDGDYCLILDPAADGRFRLVPDAPARNQPKSLFSGTLLMDFYNDCLSKLADFFRKQFTATEAAGQDLVSPAQKRFTSIVTNLFAAQYVHPDTGSYVLISPQDHKILARFYEELRKFLEELWSGSRGKTFCAMFEGARSFPKYPFADFKSRTIFGKNLKTRLRVEPLGQRAYVFGTDNVIQVYDLRAGTLALELAFPTAGAVVRDVAFSPNGKELYAIATFNNRDTLFSVATINGMQHTWGRITSIHGIVLLTLATFVSGDAVLVCAVGSLGLYRFRPHDFSPDLKPLYAFNGFGHLIVDQPSRVAYATAASKQPFTRFDRVVRLDLAKLPVPPAPPSFVYSLSDGGIVAQGDDSDDLALAPASATRSIAVAERSAGGELLVTATVAGRPNKQLLVFTALGNNAGPIKDPLDLGESTTIRMAMNPVTEGVALTFEDSYRIKLYWPGAAALADYSHPLHVQPVSLAFNERSGAAYVWNATSSTIIAIPSDRLDPLDPEIKWPLDKLREYRAAAIAAYLDLGTRVLEYVKDCFCEHLLVQCPVCDEKQDLFLACITVRGNQVFKVCNLSRRKYVKSFPTVEYWLSLVPVVPLLHTLVEKLCCMALPMLFAQHKVPQPSASVVADPVNAAYTNRFSASSVRHGIAYYEATDFRSAIRLSLSKVFDAKQFLGDYIASTQLPVRTPGVRLPANEILGSQVDAAKASLADANVNVAAVLPYDPGAVRENITRFATAPADLAPGTSVTLVADADGVVRYYQPSVPEVSQLAADVQATRQQVENTSAAVHDVLQNQQALRSVLDLSDQVTTLRTQLANMQAAHAQDLALRDQQLAQLNTNMNQQMQSHLKTVEELRAQVQELAKAAPIRRPKPPNQ